MLNLNNLIGKAMRIKPTYYLIIFVLIILNSYGCCQNVSLRVTADKEEYLVGEPIWVHISLYNDGPYMINEVNKLVLEHGIHLEDSSKTRIFPTTHADGFSSGDVAVGDSCVVDINILDHYYFRFEDIALHALPTGLYSIHIVVSYLYRPESGIGYNNIHSNYIQFRVIDPQSTEKEALRLLSLGHTYLYGDHAYKRAAEILDYLISQYPTSIYREKACEYIFYAAFKGKFEGWTEISIRYADMLLNINPDSPYITGAVAAYTWKFGFANDFEGAMKTLEKIIEDYSSTQAAEQAQWRLDRMKRLGEDEWLKFYDKIKSRIKENTH